MGKQKQIKILAVVSMLGAILFLSGCSDYNPPPKQSQSNSASNASETANADKPKDVKNEDIAKANERYRCIKDILDKRQAKWNEECHNLKKEDNCTMPPLNYLPIEKEKTDGIEECKKNFPSDAKYKGEEEFIYSLERDNCLNYAEQYYIEKWDAQCARLGRAKNCTLPWASSNPLDEMRRGERDECYNKYPNK